MSSATLQMRNIHKSFGSNKVLLGADLEARAGEVLALVGANGAGKSTLMNILAGLIQPDQGEIYINGERVRMTSPKDAADHGIAFIQQEMTLLPHMSVIDNLFITAYKKRGGFLDYRAMREHCEAALKRMGFKYAVNTLVKDLGAGDRQLVQIIRALLSNPSILIFDEATSSLSPAETERLFDTILKLREENVTIIYISHMLEEIFNITQRTMVLRGGVTAGFDQTEKLTREDIVQMMVGKDYASMIHGEKQAKDMQALPVCMEVRGLSRRGVLKDISFDLHAGEILGVWGLMGSGRTEMIRSMTGLDPMDGGTVRILQDGALKAVRPDKMPGKVGIITEDRRMDGLALNMSVRENMSVANLKNVTGRFPTLIDREKEARRCNEYVDKLKIKLSRLEQPVGTLSGGNQQKVVLGRWLQTQPAIYLLDEPTRGLDVSAKADIMQLIAKLAAEGAGVLVVMSDLDEIMRISDRYLVLFQGQAVAELPYNATNTELVSASVNYCVDKEAQV